LGSKVLYQTNAMVNIREWRACARSSFPKEVWWRGFVTSFRFRDRPSLIDSNSQSNHIRGEISENGKEERRVERSWRALEEAPLLSLPICRQRSNRREKRAPATLWWFRIWIAVGRKGRRQCRANENNVISLTSLALIGPFPLSPNKGGGASGSQWARGGFVANGNSCRDSQKRRSV
jgi:hypothetical protein